MEDQLILNLIEPDLSEEENSLHVWESFKEMLLWLCTQLESKESLIALLMLFPEAPLTADIATFNQPQECNLECLMSSFHQNSYVDKLESFKSLEEDWDDEGAAAVNATAVDHCLYLVHQLPQEVLNAQLEWFPTELGAISLRLVTAQGKLRAEIGDTHFSYFMKPTGKESERHSYEPWDEDHIHTLVHSLLSLV